MARNLPLAFAAVIGGGVLLDAAIKGASIADVIKGQASSASSSTSSTSSTGSASSSLGGGGGAVNPFAKLTDFKAGRTDQGVDVTGTPGSPILAPFAGTITAINPGWYSGQPQVVLQGAQGTPFAGKFFYVAEQLVPGVKVGQQVNAGDTIGTYAQSGTGLEAGWAANAQGETLAAATPGYSGDQSPQALAAGNSFRSFLRSLGAAV